MLFPCVRSFPIRCLFVHCAYNCKVSLTLICVLKHQSRGCLPMTRRFTVDIRRTHRHSSILTSHVMATYPYPLTITCLTSPPVQIYSHGRDSSNSSDMGFLDACLACCGLRPKREGWVYAGGGIYVPVQQVGRVLGASLWYSSQPVVFTVPLPRLQCLFMGMAQWHPKPGSPFTAAWISSTQFQTTWARSPLPQ